MKAGEVKKYVSLLLKKKNCDYNLIMNLLNKDSRKTVQKLSESVEKTIKAREKEINRVKGMYEKDRNFLKDGYIIGVDEVGRGPLAGPIVAAAVVLDLNYKSSEELILHINDSKKISAQLREELDTLIKERAISYSIIEIDNNKIDTKGIAWCNNEVLKRACEGSSVKPDLVLSDGYAIKNCIYPNEYIIKGDAKSASIACASIIAKVYRDNIMKKYAELYPKYAFEKNVGYGTKEHIEAIKKYGCTPIHRKSFLKNILNII
ncbi:ribonuclease HII [Clostridium sp. ZC22-4]|uniref:Ribonuclease HII n=2 Tax=Clostridium brassicae TaxID=2999072 RepID=A0ABT4DCY7_9CLOT|nr:ribonuclease HII [Clostridium brassicae]MCY6959508.1 ribonuclease HII [Clostridium brassicae]